MIRNYTKKEIYAAPFVAVDVDKTTDVTNKTQASVILHYVAKSEVDCEVMEAFCNLMMWAPAVAKHVLGVLEKYNCVEKLAQMYDGASVMASELKGVQAKIKETAPEALFTHCYSHKLNLVLMHSAKCMSEWILF